MSKYIIYNKLVIIKITNYFDFIEILYNLNQFFEPYNNASYSDRLKH